MTGSEQLTRRYRLAVDLADCLKNEVSVPEGQADGSPAGVPGKDASMDPSRQGTV
jgi:hypothetical protein